MARVSLKVTYTLKAELLYNGSAIAFTVKENRTSLNGRKVEREIPKDEWETLFPEMRDFFRWDRVILVGARTMKKGIERLLVEGYIEDAKRAAVWPNAKEPQLRNEKDLTNHLETLYEKQQEDFNTLRQLGILQ